MTSPPVWLSTLIDGLVALGTIALAFVAVYSDWLRAKLLPPRLRIEIVDAAGQLTVFDTNRPVVYYHLRVVNERPWMTIRDCRVMLVGVASRGPDLQFRPEPMPVPFQFIWAPSGITPALAVVHRDQICDLGYLTEPTPEEGPPVRFMPSLYAYPHHFRGFVAPGEAVRYWLQVTADGFVSEKYTVIEVSWDGRWSTNSHERSNSLVVTKLAA